MSEHIPRYNVPPPLGQAGPLVEACSPETLKLLDIIGGEPIAHLSIAALGRNYEDGRQPLTVRELRDRVEEFVPSNLRDKLPGLARIRTIVASLAEKGAIDFKVGSEPKSYCLNPDNAQHTVAFSWAMFGQQAAYPDYSMPTLWGKNGIAKFDDRGTYTLRYDLLRALEATPAVSSPTILAEATDMLPRYTGSVCERLAKHGIVTLRPQTPATDRAIYLAKPPADMPPLETAEEVLLAKVADRTFNPTTRQATHYEYKLRQQLLRGGAPGLADGLRTALVEVQKRRGGLPFIHYVNPTDGIKGKELVELTQIWRAPVRAMLQALVELSDLDYQEAAYQQVIKNLSPCDVIPLVQHSERQEANNPVRPRRFEPPQPNVTSHYIDHYGI